MIDNGNRQASTVNLAERRIFSESFRPLYAEGMGLVEETAAYLDGDGRIAAKGLIRNAATLYAAESMRLTTRLMQLASWLLLQRAANSGEMTREQVIAEKSKVRLDTGSVQDTVEAWGELPETFRDLVSRSMSLQSRVKRQYSWLRRAQYCKPGVRPDHAVADSVRAELVRYLRREDIFCRFALQLGQLVSGGMYPAAGYSFQIFFRVNINIVFF
jgi:regulator of CtrA degradation